MKKLEILMFQIVWILLVYNSACHPQENKSKNLYGDLLKKVGPSLVSINIEEAKGGGSGFFAEDKDFFEKFFEKDPFKDFFEKDPFFEQMKKRFGFLDPFMDFPRKEIITKRSVTGTIASEDGYILTTYSNIKGKIKKITIVYNGKKYDAKILGYHQRKDIALLRIKAKGLPVLKKAKVEEIKVGQFVATVGIASNNAPVINCGIVSATGRNWEWNLQVDSYVNSSNKGGLLVDLDGNFIGIISNTSPSNSLLKNSPGENSGIGFVVTIDKIDKIIPQLKEGKKLGTGEPAFLGVELDDDDKNIKGARIKRVIEGTAAEDSGIKDKDIVLEFNNEKIESSYELRRALDNFSAGDRVKIKILRDEDGKKSEIKKTIVLGKRPYVIR